MQGRRVVRILQQRMNLFNANLTLYGEICHFFKMIHTMIKKNIVGSKKMYTNVFGMKRQQSGFFKHRKVCSKRGSTISQNYICSRTYIRSQNEHESHESNHKPKLHLFSYLHPVLGTSMNLITVNIRQNNTGSRVVIPISIVWLS